MLRNLWQFTRISASVMFLAGSSWITVKLLEWKLTQLIIDATVEAMNDPEVYNEVYQLCQKLMRNLLDNQRTKEEAVDFIKQLMKEQEVEDSVVDVVVQAMKRDTFRQEFLKFSTNIATNVVFDQKLQQQLQGLIAGGISKGLTYVPEPAQVETKIRYLELPKLQGALPAPTVELEKLLKITQSSLQSFSFIKEVPKIEPTAPLAIESVELPQLEFEIEPIKLKALEFEETPPLSLEYEKIGQSDELDKYITYNQHKKFVFISEVKKILASQFEAYFD